MCGAIVIASPLSFQEGLLQKYTQKIRVLKQEKVFILRKDHHPASMTIPTLGQVKPEKMKPVKKKKKKLQNQVIK